MAIGTRRFQVVRVIMRELDVKHTGQELWVNQWNPNWNAASDIVKMLARQLMIIKQLIFVFSFRRIQAAANRLTDMAIVLVVACAQI